MQTDPTSPIYLDNAATTPIDPSVLEAMMPYLERWYGNASTAYRLGSTSKVALEDARHTIGKLLHAEGGNVFFTSGGTESNNWAIRGVVQANQINHLLTSPLEHMSVLAPIQRLQKQGKLQVHWVPIDQKGAIDYVGLEALLQRYPRSLVSLMHGNNEIGNLTDIGRVGLLCQKYGAIFHSDLVQTLGYYPMDFSTLPIDLASTSAHKLHGPKGVGLLYVKHGVKIDPLLEGGSQEKKQRAGTENLPAIVGFAKALQIATLERATVVSKLQELKQACIEMLQEMVPEVTFHGQGLDQKHSLPSIIHVAFPWPRYRDTLLLQLDMAHIYASPGSACMSGTQSHSHVLQALGVGEEKPVVRFSFSKYNTLYDVQQLAKKIAALRGRYYRLD